MSKRRLVRPRLPLLDLAAIVLGSTILIAATWALISSPSFMFAGTIVTHVDTREKVVALTFDDGPLPKHTEEILALLSDEDVKATFFVIGKEAALHESELKAIVAAGHTVGNHGYSHRMLAFVSPSLIEQEIRATDEVIRAAGYDGIIPFRAPYNLKFLALPLYLQATNRPDVSRDVITEEGRERSAEAIAKSIVEQVRPGSIILLHPMYNHTASSRAAVPLVIQDLRAKGYRFVTIPELLDLR